VLKCQRAEVLKSSAEVQKCWEVHIGTSALRHFGTRALFSTSALQHVSTYNGQ
jgi:hypothetical protein